MNALVVFGTRYGSTEKIAEEIGAVLSDEGYNVRVADAVKETVSDIAEYGVVIVGSGIKIGKWTRKALDFLERFEADLSEKKVALFVSYGYSRKSDRVNRARDDFLMKVAEKYPSIKPVSLGLFDGVFSFDRYGFGERLIFRGIKKDLEKQGVVRGNPTTSEIGKQYVSGQEKLLKVLNFS
ncbi:MAG: flavodoxin domain-containing protein [Candidatus Bathyarchaeia archaeon]